MTGTVFLQDMFICSVYTYKWDTRWRNWLRHCAASRKVAGSIKSFHWHNPSRPHYDAVVDSGSNRNDYQEYFLWGKGGRCVGLTTLPTSCADSLEILEP